MNVEVDFGTSVYWDPGGHPNPGTHALLSSLQVLGEALALGCGLA